MTHLFAGNIHQLRIANWPDRYPWLPPDAFIYFTKRTQTLPSEIDDTLNLLSEYFSKTPERLDHAVRILKFKQDVLWSMLDGLWHYFFAKECRIPIDFPRNSANSCLRVLGSAAGGGVPQWNRYDLWNDAHRHGCGCLKRMQSSFPVSVDRENWVLINCSPDFGHQWNDLVKEYPNAKLTGIVLTDIQLDHRELLSLRESDGIEIYCTHDMESVLRKDTKFIDILSRIKFFINKKIIKCGMILKRVD